MEYKPLSAKNKPESRNPARRFALSLAFFLAGCSTQFPVKVKNPSGAVLYFVPRYEYEEEVMKAEPNEKETELQRYACVAESTDTCLIHAYKYYLVARCPGGKEIVQLVAPKPKTEVTVDCNGPG